MTRSGGARTLHVLLVGRSFNLSRPEAGAPTSPDLVYVPVVTLPEFLQLVRQGAGSLSELVGQCQVPHHLAMGSPAVNMRFKRMGT